MAAKKKTRAKKTVAKKPAKKRVLKMFTAPDVTKKALQAPPVTGCHCAYCRSYRNFGFGVEGHASAPSHRLPGGNEAHNPENLARLTLKDMVPPRMFKTYTSKRGGDVMRFRGPSGLWYITGRFSTAGHFVRAMKSRTGNPVAILCLPVRIEGAPLATIVLSHYLALTTDEVACWRTANLSGINIDHVPENFKRYVPSVYKAYHGQEARVIAADEHADLNYW